MNSVEFTVYGIPVGKAPARTFYPKGSNKPVTTTPPKTRSYMQDIHYAAAKAMEGRELMKGPIYLRMDFYRPWPKYLSKISSRTGELTPAMEEKRRRAWLMTKPDWTNLAKNEDALTGVVWQDDAQVVDAHVHKEYGDPPRVEITVIEIETSDDRISHSYPGADLCLPQGAGRL